MVEGYENRKLQTVGELPSMTMAICKLCAAGGTLIADGAMWGAVLRLVVQQHSKASVSFSLVQVKLRCQCVFMCVSVCVCVTDMHMTISKTAKNI